MPRDNNNTPILNQLRHVEHTVSLLRTEVIARDWEAVEELANRVRTSVRTAISRVEAQR